jgi:hypothetical protein
VYIDPFPTAGARPATLTSKADWTDLWESPAGGFSLPAKTRVNIQFTTVDSGGGLYPNLIESKIQYSKDEGAYQNSNVYPYGSAPNQYGVITGVYFSPSFNGWVNCNDVDSVWRFKVQYRSIAEPAYAFNGSSVILTFYPYR